jgi:serine/threonine-protein kinase
MMESRNNLIGKTLGSCTLIQLIGQGGMGAVYLAQQSRPVRQVAVKVLLPVAPTNSDLYREFLARFQREANVIAQLEHINIMPVYEYGEQDGLAYLVMPYLTEGTLRDILAQRGAISADEAASYLDQAASALDYAHAHKVIHRDLKPGNFLLHNDGRLVLADFGIARIIQEVSTTRRETLTGTGMLLGTPEYMAPEMVLGEPLDHRVDIYGLGIVLFQMLSGHVPYRGNTPFAIANRHIQEPPPSLHQLNPAIPAAVDSVIQTAIAKKREERFMSAGALARAFRQAVSGNDTTVIRNQNAPTVLSSRSDTVLATPDRPAQQPIAPQYSADISSPVTPERHPLPVTPYPPAPVYTGQQNRQPALILVGVLLAMALIVGGVLIGFQFSKGSSTGTTTNGISGNLATATSAVTATSIPTSTPTTAATPTRITNGVPKGGLLYSATTPGSPCDSNGGHWADFNGVVIACLASSTEISNPYRQSPNLVGTLLTSLPNNSFPSDYVIEAQLQQASSSNADFGIYFRNQPGNQQGVYTFFIHPDGTWSAYVYDNVTGAPTEIQRGTFGDAHATVTIDVVAIGSHFTFYANGQKVGSASDNTYPTGTVGIAVDANGTVFASNFALYLPA